MKISVRSNDPAKTHADLLIVPFAANGAKFSGAAAAFDKATGGALTALREHEAFAGKEGETATVRLVGASGVTKAVLLGAGARPFDAASARKLAALAVRAARKERAKTIAFLLPEKTEG